MSGRNFSRTKIKPTFRKLSEDFVPGRQEVMIGRGKRCYEHSGNKRFHALIRANLQKYITATTKSHKSGIILGVISEIRDNSLYGGFVKKDSGSGNWYATDDANARNTTAQSFRDELHEHYKSSRQFKQKRRRGGRGSDSGSSTSESEPWLQHEAKHQCLQSYPSVQQALRDAETGLPRASGLGFDAVPSMISFEQQLDATIDMCINASSTSTNTKTSADFWSVLAEKFDVAIDPTEDPFEPTPIQEGDVLPLPSSDFFMDTPAFVKQDPNDSFMRSNAFHLNSEDQSRLIFNVRTATSA